MNKKFFFQMLCYLNLTLLFTALSNLSFMYNTVMELWNMKDYMDHLTEIIGKVFILGVYGGDMVMIYLLITFWFFHLKLILANKTTIENMEQKDPQRCLDENGQPKKFPDYSLGTYENFLQVMGTSRLLWFFPLKYYYGKPKGNGLDWGKQEQNLIEGENKFNDGKESELAERSDNKMLDKNEDPSKLTRNHPGHSSMSSLYGKSGISG
ncbi:MAG: hypothetical protein MJ252_28325 [archaeon]|nr:hypothetical protein [archaeon]